MKKIKVLSLVLCAVMLCTLFAGCENAAQSQGESTAPQEAVQEEEKKISVDGLDIEVIECLFDKEVMGFDEEISNYGYTESKGNVYVNLALKVTNNSEEDFGEDDISGYFVYEELRHDLKYDLVRVSKTSKDATIAPGAYGIVYMVARVKEGAMDADLEVTYLVKGNEFKTKVGPIDERTALEKKTEVKPGDKISVENYIDIEILECTEKEYLSASDFANSKQYKPFGGSDKKFIDMVIKVKNTSESTKFSKMNFYTILGGIQYLKDEIEISDGTDLKDLALAPLRPGEEGIIHCYTTVSKSANVEDIAIRFGTTDTCYYCKVTKKD